jgi:hypothetical protein
MVKQSKIKRIFPKEGNKHESKPQNLSETKILCHFTPLVVFSRTQPKPRMNRKKKKDREICFFNQPASKAQRRTLLCPRGSWDAS